MEHKTELEKVLATPTEITLPKSGIKTRVRELSMSDLREVSEFKALQKSFLADFIKDAPPDETLDPTGGSAMFLIEFISDNSTSVVKFCALCCDLPPEGLYELCLTDLIALYSAIIKENQAFFLPSTVRMLAQLSRGQKSSPPLSATVTPTETSAATH